MEDREEAFRLFYRESGDRNAPPLVLLHGNGEDSTYFSAQIADFSDTYHVIAPDTRGHGKSPRGDAPFTLAQFAEDLDAFLDSLSIEKTDLLGFSDGGNIALLFTLRHPEKVRRLILNGANLDPKGVRRRTQIPIEIGYRAACRRAERSPAAKANAEMLGLMVHEPHIDPKELACLSMPVLVIAGTHDMIRRRHTERIAAAIPDARLVLLPGGHFIAARSPDAFDREVRGFLNER